MRINPFIRVVTLILVAAVLSRGRIVDLWLTSLLLGTLFLVLGASTWQGLWRMVLRIRWLLLSLVLIYGWLTPGAPVLPAAGALSPTLSGLGDGALRALVLLLMVSAVHLLLKTTSRQELLSALYQLSRLGHPAGLDPERFALRVVLTLETVPKVQDLVVQTLARQPSGRRKISRSAADIFMQALQQADAAAPLQVKLPAPQPIPTLQWLIPPAVAMLFWAVGLIAWS